MTSLSNLAAMRLLITVAELLIATTVSILILVICWHRYLYSSRRKQYQQKYEQKRTPCVIGFFHPYCSSGGGGERVLWAIVKSLNEVHEQGIPLKFIIYTIDPTKDNYKLDLLNNVKERFEIDISPVIDICFVHLNDYKHLLAPASRFSMLVEAWRTARLAYIALCSSLSEGGEDGIPSVFFDTTGYAFSYVVANILFGCKVVAYVHYPTISTDMLSLVWERRRATYNNPEYIAGSQFTTSVKLVYYILYAIMYGMVGSLCHLVLVNSTWTYNHIASLWKIASLQDRIQIVYPPCRMANYSSLEKKQTKNRENVILSIGQFRPEKDHELQIQSLSLLHHLYPETKLQDTVKLIVIGSCRGKDDEIRLYQLKQLTTKLQLENYVQFCVNQPYTVIQDWLQRASIGIHTMWNEHFGIGIVEMMSAGLIVVAHNSGGPRSDIVVPLRDESGSNANSQKTGFLASNAEEYAQAIYTALSLDYRDSFKIRQNASLSAKRFADEIFITSMKRSILDSGILSKP